MVIVLSRDVTGADGANIVTFDNMLLSSIKNTRVVLDGEVIANYENLSAS